MTEKLLINQKMIVQAIQKYSQIIGQRLARSTLMIDITKAGLCLFAIFSMIGISACQQTPQVYGRMEFAPTQQTPQRANVLGISNESGQIQIYGSLGVESQYQNGKWSQ